ncbi:VOC family protein [bacterium]|nr:MAG: VOC family protein [bacterium]
MNPVGWFEIPVNDFDKAKKFYEGVFGVEISVNVVGPLKMGWFPMDNMDKYGATGSLVQGVGYTPSSCGVIIYFSVPDIEASLKKVEALGGKTLLAKTDIGEYGFMAHFLDTEGNHVAFHTAAKM